jgi:transcriptional regulator with XRE-family HTH domain
MKQSDSIVINDFKSKLASNLKVLRMASDLTSYEFAEKIEVSKSHLFNLERGLAKNMSLRTLYYLSRLTNLEDLFKEQYDLLMGHKSTKDEG